MCPTISPITTRKSPPLATDLFHGPTFAEQAESFLVNLHNRKRNPLSPNTINLWSSAVRNWINPEIGGLALLKVNNMSVRPLVQAMVAAKLSAWTIRTYVLVVKMVVDSAIDDAGEPMFPRTWRSEILDMPSIKARLLNTPCFSPEIMSGLATWHSPRERFLSTLAGGSGGRISELLGLDIGKHISPDCSTIRIARQAYRGRLRDELKTSSAYREIDLASELSTLLRDFFGGRTSGLLFATATGKPLASVNILRYHLHPALRELGYINPHTGNHIAGMHAFRRFRETTVGKCFELPHNLRLFWMGRSGSSSMTFVYDHVWLDRANRKLWAERCGLGFSLPMSGPASPR